MHVFLCINVYLYPKKLCFCVCVQLKIDITQAFFCIIDWALSPPKKGKKLDFEPQVCQFSALHLICRGLKSFQYAENTGQVTAYKEVAPLQHI